MSLLKYSVGTPGTHRELRHYLATSRTPMERLYQAKHYDPLPNIVKNIPIPLMHCVFGQSLRLDHRGCDAVLACTNFH